MLGVVGVKKNEAQQRVVYWNDQEKDKVLTLEEIEEINSTKEEYNRWSLLA